MRRGLCDTMKKAIALESPLKINYRSSNELNEDTLLSLSMVGKLVEKEVLESPFSLYSNWFFFLLPGLCSHFTSLLSGHTYALALVNL